MKQQKKRGTGTGTGPAGWLSDGKRHGKRRLVAREGAARRADLRRNGATVREAAPVFMPGAVVVGAHESQAGSMAARVMAIVGNLRRADREADRELTLQQAAGARARVRGRESARAVTLREGREDVARGRFTAPAIDWLATWAVRRVVVDHQRRGINLGDCARDFADGAVRECVCRLAVRHPGWFARLGQIVGRRADLAALLAAAPMGGAWGCSVSAIADNLATADVGRSSIYGLAVRWARRGLRAGRGLGEHRCSLFPINPQPPTFPCPSSSP